MGKNNIKKKKRRANYHYNQQHQSKLHKELKRQEEKFLEQQWREACHDTAQVVDDMIEALDENRGLCGYKYFWDEGILQGCVPEWEGCGDPNVLSCFQEANRIRNAIEFWGDASTDFSIHLPMCPYDMGIIFPNNPFVDEPCERHCTLSYFKAAPVKITRKLLTNFKDHLLGGSYENNIVKEKGMPDLITKEDWKIVLESYKNTQEAERERIRREREDVLATYPKLKGKAKKERIIELPEFIEERLEDKVVPVPISGNVVDTQSVTDMTKVYKCPCGNGRIHIPNSKTLPYIECPECGNKYSIIRDVHNHEKITLMEYALSNVQNELDLGPEQYWPEIIHKIAKGKEKGIRSWLSKNNFSIEPFMYKRCAIPYPNVPVLGNTNPSYTIPYTMEEDRYCAKVEAIDNNRILLEKILISHNGDIWEQWTGHETHCWITSPKALTLAGVQVGDQIAFNAIPCFYQRRDGSVDITLKWIRDVELSNYLKFFNESFTKELKSQEEKEQASLKACQHCMMFQKCNNQYVCMYEEYHQKCTDWLLTKSKESEFWLIESGYLEGYKGENGQFELKLKIWSDKPLLDLLYESIERDNHHDYSMPYMYDNLAQKQEMKKFE